MNVKTLSVLASAAVVALIAAIWINVANAPVSEESAKDKPLLPGLSNSLNNIDGVTLSGAGGKALVTLKRSGAGWEVAEKSNYPADLGKLREYLYKLADAKVLDTKTASPKRYPDLDVEDPIDPKAKSVLVAINGVKELPKLIVGLYNGQGGGGTFVRREGEAQSLLASGNLLAEKDPSAWIRHDLLDIDAAKIKEVKLTGLDGKTLAVHKNKPEDTNFSVDDVPKGREPASEFVANALGSGLSSLRADDVASAKDMPAPDKVYKAQYVCFDGLRVQVVAWEADGKAHAQFSASVDGEGANAPSADAAKSAQGSGTAKATADDINSRLGAWTYTVPPYMFSNFHKTMDELLKPVETKSAAGAKGAKSAVPILPSKP